MLLFGRESDLVLSLVGRGIVLLKRNNNDKIIVVFELVRGLRNI